MAGLVIDSSTPPSHTAAAGFPANTCAAFSPPADPLLLVAWAGNSQANVTTPGIASSPSQTWVTDGWDREASGSPTMPGQAAMFHAVITGTPGSSTVTVTNQEPNSTFQSSMMKVYVITGHDPVTPVGAVNHDRQSDGSTLSDSYVASITGGQGFMVICDWNAGSVAGWTADSGCTIEDKGTFTGEISYAVVRRTDPDGVNGAATSVGISGLPAGGQYHWVIAEVISLEAAIAAAQAAGYPSFGANAPMF